MASLRSSFRSLQNNRAVKPPSHMRTGRAIIRAEGISPATMSRMVNALVASGQWQKKPYPIAVNGVVRPIPHYGPKR